MTEQEFTDQFIGAANTKDHRKIRNLCQKACRTFGDERASELANDCFEAIVEVDAELGDWLDSWFKFGCWA